MSLLPRNISDTPIAIIDLETTGLSPVSDRIVEVAVVRIDPGQGPRLVLETLVNPQRRVSGSEIHGIYDDDVVGAPTFRDIVTPLAAAIDGAVVASFNVYFDIKFLLNEIALAAQPVAVPHLCLMWMRPGLGLGQRGSLERTCADLGVPFVLNHQAASDAVSAAGLWPIYSEAAATRGARTFGDLAALKSYKFMSSWSDAPLDARRLRGSTPGTALKPRAPRDAHEQAAVREAEWRTQAAVATYWEALTAALMDQHITNAERAELRRLQSSPLIRPETLRYIHARVLAGVLDEVSRDLRVDDAEMEWVSSVADLLRELGWAPGGGMTLPVMGPPPAADTPSNRWSISADPPTPPSRAWWSRIVGG